MSLLPVPIATRRQLAARGIRRPELERGLASARFVRIRPGYYGAPDAPANLVAAVHLAPDRIVAVLDSVLHQRLLPAAPFEALLRTAPRRVRRAVGGALDGRAESGLESIVRYVLRCAGIDCAVQVEIAGIGWVDLMVDGWLIIEADGGQHSAPEQMRKDRRRDATAVLLGLRTLRLGGDLVLYDQQSMLDVVRSMLADGRPRAAAW